LARQRTSIAESSWSVNGEPGRQRNGEAHVLAQVHHQVGAHLVAVRHAGHAHQRQSGALDRAGRQHHDRAAIAVAGERAAEVERAVAGVDADHFLNGRASGESVAARGQAHDVTVRHDHQPLGGVVQADLAECRPRRRDAERHAAELVEREKSRSCDGLHRQGSVELEALDEIGIGRIGEFLTQLGGHVLRSFRRVVGQLRQRRRSGNSAIGVEQLLPQEVMQRAIDEVVGCADAGRLGGFELETVVQIPFERQVLDHGPGPQRIDADRAHRGRVHLRFEIARRPAAEVQRTAA
jgi:hypothetical protein